MKRQLRGKARVSMRNIASTVREWEGGRNGEGDEGRHLRSQGWRRVAERRSAVGGGGGG